MVKQIYSSDSLIKKPGVFFRDMFRDLLKSRELAWRLALRDISAQYRQSFLGILWAFILPLGTTLIWIFMRNTGLVNISKTDIPYPAYVFSGTLLWAIFMESLQAPIQRVAAAKAMLSKINFPKESIILSGIYQVVFNGAIKIVLLIVALLIMGIYPSWNILYFPFAFISLILIGTAIGLLLTPIGMLYNDIGKAMPLILQFAMYITPIVFPMPQSGMVLKLLNLNPLTPIIIVSRSLITGAELHYLSPFIWINIVFLGLFFIAWVVFRVAMPILVERMSS